MLASKIESILFVANRPMGVKKLTEVCEVTRDELSAALDEIATKYNGENSGIRLLRNGNDVQLSTAPDNSKLVQEFLKDETTGELSKPSLETLTIIAYRGPVSKAELEQIRGVNCSLILRNLLMRGLVEAQGEPYEPQTTFRVTMDFVRFLGVSSVEELPDYEKLRSHENIVRVLEMNAKPAEAAAAAPAVGEESAAAEGSPVEASAPVAAVEEESAPAPSEAEDEDADEDDEDEDDEDEKDEDEDEADEDDEDEDEENEDEDEDEDEGDAAAPAPDTSEKE